MDLGRAGFALEIVGELEDGSEGDRWAVDVVDASYGFPGVPGGADFSVGVAGVEEATPPCSAPVADTFGGGGETPSYPIQRVLAASVSEGSRSGPASVLRRVAGWRAVSRENGSATCRASGSTSRYAVRYGPDMPNTAQRMPSHHISIRGELLL